MDATQKTIPQQPGMSPEASKTRALKAKRVASAKQFGVDFVLPMAIGIVGTLILYKLVLPMFPAEGEGFLRSIREKLAERESIPVVCTFLLFWHLGYVLVRYFVRVRPEFRVFAHDPISAGANELGDRELHEIAQKAVLIEQHQGGSILTKRILLAVARLGIKRDTAELGDLLRQRADADRYRTSNGYAIPGFIVWAIPILGFVGTVLGIGGAVANLKGALGNVNDISALSGELSKVTENLGVAFDTTLVALVMSIIALLVQTLVAQKEERLLADIEDYLTYRLQSRIRSEDEESRLDDVMRTALAKLIELEEKIHAEAGERAQMGMQSMMSAQESINNTMTLMPQMLDQAAGSSADKLGESMQRVANQLESIVGTGDRLATLQTAMQENLDQIAHVQGMTNTMTEVRDAMLKLTPILSKLDRPIPLTFSVGGMVVAPDSRSTPPLGGSAGV